MLERTQLTHVARKCSMTTELIIWVLLCSLFEVLKVWNQGNGKSSGKLGLTFFRLSPQKPLPPLHPSDTPHPLSHPLTHPSLTPHSPRPLTPLPHRDVLRTQDIGTTPRSDRAHRFNNVSLQIPSVPPTIRWKGSGGAGISVYYLVEVLYQFIIEFRYYISLLSSLGTISVYYLVEVPTY